MYCYYRTCSLSFDIVDKLTEDASMMMDQQENKAGCIRTILMDFVKANGIANNYTEIPEKERLEKFFGAAVYSGKAANTPQPGKKEPGGRKCRLQFDVSDANKLTNDVLAMLYIHANKSLLIRELYLDFVKANGIVSNYTEIPEKERLERFFGYTARIARPAKQPDRAVETRQGKDSEIQPCRHGSVRADSGVTFATPDGITIRIIVGQAP